MPVIVWFSDIRKNDVAIAGGKGANLGEMYQAGFPIPQGFIITAQTYSYFLEKADIKPDMDDLLKNLNVNNTDELNAASKAIKSLITSTRSPPEIEAEILKAYRTLSSGSTKDVIITGGDIGAFVAVRSSATAEDLPDASFAGQQKTFLNVRGEKELLKAVKECWASLFEPRAIFYRVEKGFEHSKVLISVVVQRMVDSDKSGVMFTVNPMTNDEKQIVIEGSWGLGEAIVSGEVTPDSYIVAKDSLEIIQEKVEHKAVMYTRDMATGITKKVPLSSETAEKKILSSEEVKNLAEYGKRIEEHYKYPQDIEWAIEDDKIYITQSRAITTLKKEEILSEDSSQQPTAKSQEPATEKTILVKGFGASPGVVTGPVKIVKNLEELSKVQKGDILVTEMTTPDMVPAMERAVGIVTNSGGVTSHAAIVSRELGIPCIVGSGNATEVLKDRDLITIDARDGVVYEGAVKISEEKVEEPPETVLIPSGTKTKIYVNLGVPHRAEEVSKLPVDGVGLMREEFILASMICEHPLAMIERHEEQKFIDILAESISKVAKHFYPRPIVLRLSDLKTNEYRELKGGEKFEQQEENPMIGWRGCSRYTTEKYAPAFRLELKAVKKVRESGLDNVWIMLPFVRTLRDITEVEKLMKEEGLERGEKLKLWIMAEVPSNVILADEFAKLVDGFSIGSNDLTQLIMGADRDSKLLAELGYFDERNEAVKRAISHLIKVAHQNGKTVSICGQAPSVYPEFCEFLIREGIDSISVNPDVAVKTRKFVEEIERKILF